MRVLILSLHFPPITGMSSRAMAEVSRAMVAAGNEVQVLTVVPVRGHPVYRCDPGEARFIAPGVAVDRIPMGPVNRWFGRGMRCADPVESGANVTRASTSPVRRAIGSCVRWAYGARRLWQPLAVPDASIDWLPRAALEARRLLRANRFDLVVSLGNPHTCHLAAYLATRGLRCAWVPFYGDSWGLDPALAERPAPAAAISRMLERIVLKGAAGVAVCTDAMKTSLVETYGIEPDAIASTPIAFTDLDAYEAVAPMAPRWCFSLVYTGQIYPGLQDPMPFLRAASRIATPDMAVSFVGAIPEQSMRAASELGLDAQFPGWRPPQRIIEDQKNASVLLLFGHRGAHGMPSKIFEYFAARRPILAICADSGDLIAPLISKHRRGLIVDNREEDIEDALRCLIGLHRRGALDGAFDLGLLREYSAPASAKRLMNGIIAAAARKPARLAIPVTTTDQAV
jgi:glycosyltransferase involved in cell wall biosynthesis